MKQLLFYFLTFILLFSCKKLEQKDFYLENNCSSCKDVLEKSVLNLSGIYYADYDWEAGRLTVKFDTEEFASGILYDYLQKHSYIRDKDSTSLKKPICCKD